MTTPGTNLTRYLSKLPGVYCLLVRLAMVTRKPAMVAMIKALMRDDAVLFLVGVIGVSIGLAMIFGHSRWSGGWLPVLVTNIGWTTLLKGLCFLFLSPDAATGIFLGALHYEQLFYLYTSITLVPGILLTYGGFRKE